MPTMPNGDIFPKLRLQIPAELALTFSSIHNEQVSDAFYTVPGLLSSESTDPGSYI